MNMLRTSTRFAISRLFTKQTVSFSGDSWKDRDQAAQKVYINRKQRQTLKKLLDQVQNQQLDKQSNTQRFQSQLVQIMKRYKIQNQTLRAEIAFLHRDLRQ